MYDSSDSQDTSQRLEWQIKYEIKDEIFVLESRMLSVFNIKAIKIVCNYLKFCIFVV